MKKAMNAEERQAVKDRLEQIAARNGGRLTADDVVADAKRKDSPLHAHFEWDTKKAAAEYWVMQARDLITSIKITVRTETQNVVAVGYVRDPRCSSSAQGYVAVQMVRTDSDLAREVLLEEFGRVASMLRRAREVAGVLGIEEEVEGMLRSVVGLRQRLDQPSAVQ